MFPDTIVSCTHLVLSFLQNETYVPLSKELQNKSGEWMYLAISVRQMVIQFNWYQILGSAYLGLLLNRDLILIRLDNYNTRKTKHKETSLLHNTLLKKP